MNLKEIQFPTMMHIVKDIIKREEIEGDFYKCFLLPFYGIAFINLAGESKNEDRKFAKDKLLKAISG